MSADPNQSTEVARLPGGLRSFFSTNWLRTLGAYRRCDAVVFGGGSLFTDVELVYACFLWFLHGMTAVACHKPLILTFQGVGPFKQPLGERLAKWVFRHAAFVSVRDAASMKRVETFGLSIKIIQTFDPVFSIMVKQKPTHQSKNVCTIIPRANSSEALMQAAISVLRIQPYIHHVRILLMQPENAGEQGIARRLERELGLPATIVPVRTLSDLMKGVEDSLIVVTQRFHGGLAAVALGIDVKIVTQGAGDKLAELRALVMSGFDVAIASALIQDGEQALRETLYHVTRGATA